MAQRSLSVEYVPLASLRLDPPKPEYSDKQLGQLANGIRIFGFNAPILVDAPFTLSLAMAFTRCSRLQERAIANAEE